jgi:hypothetical protein
MCAERRRAGCRGRCEANHRVGVARRLGVVRETGQVALAAGWVRERFECSSVQLDPPVGRDRLIDREAHELVAKRDALGSRREHARRQALVETIEHLPGEPLQQPELRLGQDDRDRLEEPPRGRREARGTRKDRVPHRVRHLVDSRRQHLDDEERVAASLAIELARIHAVRLGEARNRGRRQSRELEPSNRVIRRQLAEHDPERVRWGELVVAVAGDDQARNRLDPPREQPQHVKRRLVGPVHVLEHQDGRRPGLQLPREGAHELVRHHRTLYDLREVATHRLGDIEQRAERTRSEQRITAAPENPRRSPARLREAP